MYCVHLYDIVQAQKMDWKELSELEKILFINQSFCFQWRLLTQTWDKKKGYRHVQAKIVIKVATVIIIINDSMYKIANLKFENFDELKRKEKSLAVYKGYRIIPRFH